MAQRGELFPTVHKVTLCASSSHKGNYKTWCKGRSVYLVLEKMGGGKISDCWEFSLDNDRGAPSAGCFPELPIVLLISLYT